jgi:hypothetical protein
MSQSTKYARMQDAYIRDGMMRFIVSVKQTAYRTKGGQV